MNVFKKLFTLIELITVIVVLSILAAIVIPNIGEWTGNATKSAVESNMRNLQTAVDKYKHNKGDFPTAKNPTLYSPEAININVLYPQYIKNKPETGKYWVDYSGRVWGSTIDAPNEVTYSDKFVQWENVVGSEGYQLHMIQKKGSILSKLLGKTSFSVKELPIFKNIKQEQILSYPKEEDEYLVSAIDEFGLPTVPVGKGYEGFPIMTDDFIPFPLNNLGTYYVTTNAGAKAKWIAMDVQENKPEGTNIIYSFATSDDGKKYGDFKTNLSEVSESKYIKVKIELVSLNNNKPSLLKLKVKFQRSGSSTLNQDFFSTFSINDLPAGIQVYDNVGGFSSPNGTKGIGLAPNETNSTFTQTYPLGQISYIKDIQSVSSTPTGTGIEQYYQTSMDGVNYSEPTLYPETLPQGRYLKVTTVLTRDNINIPTPLILDLFIQLASSNPNKLPTAPSNNLDKAIENQTNGEEWVTLDKMNFIFDAGEVGKWISAEGIDEQPEKTRILYFFSTSNDELSWSKPTLNLEEVSNSVYLNVDVVLQVQRDSLKEPKFYEVVIDYELPDGTSVQKSGTSGQSFNIQQAIDKYYLINNSYPTAIQPEALLPATLDFSKLYPNYLSYKPSIKTVKYWVDYNGKVWISTVDAPQNIQVNGSTISWNTVENAVMYKVYKLPDNTTGSLSHSQLTYIATVNIPKFVGEGNSTYVISSVDEHGNQSAPSGKGYIGFINQPPNAVITMNPSSNILTTTNLVWDWSQSSDSDGDKIIKVEWKVNDSNISTPPTNFTAGSHKVELRVQDSKGDWSSWVSKTFVVSNPTPNAPSGFTSPNGSLTLGSTYTIQWNATNYWGSPSTNSKYRLEVSYNGGAYSVLSSNLTSNSYSHTLSSSTTYTSVQYRVRAESDGGISNWVNSNALNLIVPLVRTGETFTFTTAGANGQFGPVQSNLDTSYMNTNLKGKVQSQGGIQLWSIPSSGKYKIEVFGAESGNIWGGNTVTGKGAIMKGEFNLQQGTTLNIVVGQRGQNNGGGGGGSFVWKNNDTLPIIVAGGGGGPGGHPTSGYFGSGKNASTGNNGVNANGSGVGGTNGQAGQAGSTLGSNGLNGSGGGGSGWYSDAIGGYSGDTYKALKRGGRGGSGGGATGGFGGGGSSWLGGGGGGGYSGGGGGTWSSGTGGGGGGSYNVGTNQQNTVGNVGDGKVILTFLGY